MPTIRWAENYRMELTLTEIKRQCRLDEDFTEEDDLLIAIGQAAVSRTATRLNRKLYKDVLPEDDPDGLVVSADIRLGILLLVSHFYENREAVAETKHSELPLGYAFLVDPYKLILL